jgi:hypothetical protein
VLLEQVQVLGLVQVLGQVLGLGLVQVLGLELGLELGLVPHKQPKVVK